jgi:hypothetical protein
LAVRTTFEILAELQNTCAAHAIEVALNLKPSVFRMAIMTFFASLRDALGGFMHVQYII